MYSECDTKQMALISVFVTYCSAQNLMSVLTVMKNNILDILNASKYSILKVLDFSDNKRI